MNLLNIRRVAMVAFGGLLLSTGLLAESGSSIVVSIEGMTCASTGLPPGSFEAASWSLPFSNTASGGGASGGAGAGKFTFGDLVVNKGPDACTTVLLGYLSSGTLPGKLTLTQRISQGGPTTRIILTLMNPTIRASTVAGSVEANSQETLTIHFRTTR